MSKRNNGEDPVAGLAPEATGARRGFWTRWGRTLLLLGAAVLVGASYFFSMWQITLHAPQYPNGLTAKIVGTGLSGDVNEIDTLNHYIGMRSLTELGYPELKLWPWGIIFLVVVYLAGAFIFKRRLGSILVWGAALYPVVFAADLWRWLDYSGHNLDRSAAMSSSIEPFMPAFVGGKMVGQFETVATFGPGFWMAVAASILAIIAGIIGWRRTSRK